MVVLFWDLDGTLLFTGRAGPYAFEEALLEVTGVEASLQDLPTAGPDRRRRCPARARARQRRSDARADRRGAARIRAAAAGLAPALAGPRARRRPRGARGVQRNDPEIRSYLLTGEHACGRPRQADRTTASTSSSPASRARSASTTARGSTSPAARSRSPTARTRLRDRRHSGRRGVRQGDRRADDRRRLGLVLRARTARGDRALARPRSHPAARRVPGRCSRRRPWPRRRRDERSVRAEFVAGAASFTPYVAVEVDGLTFLVSTHDPKMAKFFASREAERAARAGDGPADHRRRPRHVRRRRRLPRHGRAGRASLGILLGGRDRTRAGDGSAPRRGNVALNDAQERVRIVAAALSDLEGTAELDLGPAAGERPGCSAGPTTQRAARRSRSP